MERGAPESKPTTSYYFPTVLPNPATRSTLGTRGERLNHPPTASPLTLIIINHRN